MAWIESVAEAQRRARRVLPTSVYKAVLAGAERGQTLRDNVEAFAELGFAPHVAGSAANRPLSPTVMGVDMELPVILSPTGVQAVHPDAELAVARASAARGVAMGLSGFASTPIEEAVAANPRTFAQLYWAGSREAIEARVTRARAAGARGVVVTPGWALSPPRGRGSPALPPPIGGQTKGEVGAAGPGGPGGVPRRL